MWKLGLLQKHPSNSPERSNLPEITLNTSQGLMILTPNNQRYPSLVLIRKNTNEVKKQGSNQMKFFPGWVVQAGNPYLWGWGKRNWCSRPTRSTVRVQSQLGKVVKHCLKIKNIKKRPEHGPLNGRMLAKCEVQSPALWSVNQLDDVGMCKYFQCGALGLGDCGHSLWHRGIQLGIL